MLRSRSALRVTTRWADGVADPALLVTTVGLAVVVLEQATTASIRDRDRAHSGQTSGSHPLLPNHLHRSRTMTPRPPLLLRGRQAPYLGPACPAAWELPDETMMLSPSLRIAAKQEAGGSRR